MTKKIKIATFLIGLLGLINELKLLYFDNWNEFDNPIFIGLDFFRSINLRFFTDELSKTSNVGFHFNIFNITFYIFLLISVLLYHFSKNKETRLLRFLLSFIFLDNLITIIWIVIYNLIPKDVDVDVNRNQYQIYLTILYLLVKVVFVVLAYFSLKYFRDNSSLDYTVNTIGEESKNHIILTRKWQRFFHLIMDTFCTILLFSFIIELPILKHPIFKNEFMSVIVLFVIRMCYYIAFEAILGATPAKFLTESRVIDGKGNKPDFINIFTRSFFRFIPFEPFSFFGSKGWHDSLSNTYVAKEKRNGVKANTYLLIFPILIVGLLAIYFGRYAYVQHQIHESQKQKFELTKKQIEDQIKNISSNTIIHIEAADYTETYSGAKVYLKVESISNNTITASLLIMESNYNESILKVEEYYNSFKSVVKKVTFNKSDLNKMYMHKFEDYEHYNMMKADILKENIPFRLVDIQTLYEPKLELTGSRGFEGDKITISLENYGWKADIIEYKSKSGDVKWQIDNTSNDYSDTQYLYYTLIGYNYNANDDLDLIIKMKDIKNKIHTYHLTGDFDNMELNKIE